MIVHTEKVAAELPNQEPLVDVAAAAKHLCFSTMMIRRMAAAGSIPCYRYGLGKRSYYRFRLSELAHPQAVQQVEATPQASPKRER